MKTPRVFARNVGTGFIEYLARALSHRAALVEPKDLAWLLASYARDGLSRVEAVGDVESVVAVRESMEESLGIKFDGEKGDRFFRSTLIQTLFYGVFSAWVLWSRGEQKNNATLPEGDSNPQRFRWRLAVWHLRAPVLKALFKHLSDPDQLESLGLVEVLDWAESAFGRVDRSEFFNRFNEGEAVPYFYEPFLEAFDPELRKELGVWYTPPEVVRYMVARVDQVLKDDLGTPEGLAAKHVYVLDPCCGTGAYLAEVLRCIDRNLQEQGHGALTGAAVKEAATERVFGFEIMPAPFVVAHLQVGLTMQDLDAALADDGSERPGVILTNALTDWETRTTKRARFPGLDEERARAEVVKQKTPILVILGNPPYDGFAGMAVEEERELSRAYRTVDLVQEPEGKGLNDLYVRFFRMAERRIAEKTGQGVVCFISNYSWLEGLSFTGMRERLLNVFDALRIDCLNGDKFKTNKTTPDGSPDPSIFSTERDATGIQVGTAITTLIRKKSHRPAESVGFRHLWGRDKREQLIATKEAKPGDLYSKITPDLPLGLPFMPTDVSTNWHDWPALPELFPDYFQGVMTARDGFLVDTDLPRLRTRLADYFNRALSHEEIARLYPKVMESTKRFGPLAVRDRLLSRGGPEESGFMRFAYRPFDTRWLYWEKETKLLDEKRADYLPHVFEGNSWLEARKREAKDTFSRGTLVRDLAETFGNGVSAWFPIWLFDKVDRRGRRANLSEKAERYLARLGHDVEDLFYYVLATLHDRAYRDVNAGPLRVGWPRIPLPGWPDAEMEGAAESLASSAARGRLLAVLLDSEGPVSGEAERLLLPVIAQPRTNSGRNMADEHFAVTANWGYLGSGGVVMPGSGRVIERKYSPREGAELGERVAVLGDSTIDVYLNEEAYWANVPSAVWSYMLGGHQVLKKWLSYREQRVLDRPLRAEEVEHFSDTARRIAAILLLTYK